AWNVSYGRRSGSGSAERILPDARSEECIRSRWLGIYYRERKKSNSHDSGPLLAIDRLPRGRDEARQHLDSWQIDCWQMDSWHTVGHLPATQTGQRLIEP